MRTKRKTAKATGANGEHTPVRKKVRQPRNYSLPTEISRPVLDDFRAELTQVNIPQIPIPSVDVSVKEECETSVESAYCGNTISEYGSKEVCKSKIEASTLPLGRQEANESLAVPGRCLNEAKYEIIDAGSHGNKKTVVNYSIPHSSVAFDGRSLAATATVNPSDRCKLATPCTTIVKAEKLSNGPATKKFNASNGPSKLYRFMICEWFYSHIDRSLFAEGYSKSRDMGALLKVNYPSLYTRSLNRVQWNYIRMRLRKERPVRRFSHTFLLEERINLERRREKLRFLMYNALIEYLDDDIPSTIPKPIDIGSTVRGTTFTPHYGSYTGVIVDTENSNIPSFRVRFTHDGRDGEQLLPDYRVALDQSFHIAEASDTVTITSKHLKQVALLEVNVHEKVRLLHELENIRLNLAARHAMGKCDIEQDRGHIERYDQTVRKLLQLNRNLLQLTKQVATDYEQYVSEPLVADDGKDVPVVDKYVVDAADQLLAAYAQLDHIFNNPVADRLWQATMQRLHKRPEYLQQFEIYLASSIGTLFDIVAVHRSG
uniref:DIRP domain-containing protein n=1 Tax=Anopheles minimus TaxID=112268 RepID=A0A182WCX5_9DIPT